MRMCLVYATVCGLLCAIAHAQAGPTLAVYTATQAKRGSAVYFEACSGCHLYDLSGGKDPDGIGDAPPLAGDKFARSWNGETVGSLVNVVRTTMPFDKPRTLTPDECFDVVAYILSVNHFPPGDRDLGRDEAALRRLLFSDR